MFLSIQEEAALGRLLPVIVSPLTVCLVLLGNDTCSRPSAT
jgi:hypothetical protein